MAKVSISAAAKIAGISRSNFYKNYIKKGKISVSKDHQGRPHIDTSEVLRVFGVLQGVTPELSLEAQEIQSTIQKVTTFEVSKNTLLEMENRLLKEQLAKAEEREEWYRQQMGELSGVLKQLECQRENKRPWWRRR